MGEGTIDAFEQVYLGNKSVEDMDWVTKVLGSKLSLGLVEKARRIFAGASDGFDAEKIAGKVAEAFLPQKGK